MNAAPNFLRVVLPTQWFLTAQLCVTLAAAESIRENEVIAQAVASSLGQLWALVPETARRRRLLIAKAVVAIVTIIGANGVEKCV